MHNTGILGGSFDPFHYGHLSIVEAALALPDLDTCILMPARVSPFKVGHKMASEHDRLAMIRLVAEEYEELQVSTIEMEDDEVSYTFKTLTRLQDQRPDDRLWFIMGSDSLLQMETWYKGKELLGAFSFMVAPRPGYDKQAVDACIEQFEKTYGTEIRILQNEQYHISSTEIKAAIQEGRSIEKYVPPVVERYIYEHGLYT